MSDILWAATSAVLGLVVGSFLNVVIHRLPLMMDQAGHDDDDLAYTPKRDQATTTARASVAFSLIFPGSHCPKCKHPIPARQNLPLLGYCVLSGVCGACGKSISARYPIVELLAATAALVSVLIFGPSLQALATMTFLWFAIAIGFIDAEHLLVPDTLSLSLLWMGLVFNVFSLHVGPGDAILGATAGYGSLWAVDKVATRILGRTAIGQGDLKLFAAIGAWFGWQTLAPSLLVASVTGAIVGYLLIWTGYSRKGEPICFAPFLLLGASAVVISNGLHLTWARTPFSF